VKVPALARIERLNLILAVAATSGAGLVWGGRGMLAAGAGGAMACANFWALRRLGVRAAARARDAARAGEAGPALALGGALVAKMTILFALVWLAVRVAGLAVLPFALGLSVFVPSILMVGLTVGLGTAGAEAEV
jgi:hypothetical protein